MKKIVFNHLVIAILSLFAVFISCKKEDDEITAQKGDVFVAGRGYTMLWKNGVEQKLAGANSVMMDYASVYVSSNDVYVIGNTSVLGLFSTLWKNGKMQYSINNALMFSVAVSGNDVYIVGYEHVTTKGGSLRHIATLWKNGVAQHLVDENTERSRAHSVFVSDSVYVAGISAGNAVVWKNGKAQALGKRVVWKNDEEHVFDSGTAYSVFVSRGDVYVAGTSGGWVTVWKNGEVQEQFSDGGTGYSIFVSNSKVYVAGVTSGGDAAIWIDGEREYLTDRTISSVARSVYVSGSDVYVAGYKDSGRGSARLFWKNGDVQEFGGSGVSRATSVFVVE